MDEDKLSKHNESAVKPVDAGIRCPYCGSTNCYGMSRVVGYFSRIDNWNSSKTGEFKDRQKGDYKIDENRLGNWETRVKKN